MGSGLYAAPFKKRLNVFVSHKLLSTCLFQPPSDCGQRFLIKFNQANIQHIVKSETASWSASETEEDVANLNSILIKTAG